VCRHAGARAFFILLLTCEPVALIMAHAPAAAQEPRPAVSHAVEIHDFAFRPNEIVAAVGDTIVFTNQDAFLHSVADDKRAWNSAGIPHGRTWRLVVTGPVSFHCAFHPSMKGSLSLE
jgi:plastocyanin